MMKVDNNLKIYCYIIIIIMSNWEKDSNIELLDNDGDKYVIKVNDMFFDNYLKNNVLTDMEIEDRFNEWECNGDDIIFCRIISNKFGFEKDSYIIIHFIKHYDDEINYFTIYYTKDVTNKELASDLFKEKTFCGCSDKKINYKEKTIFIEPKVRIFYKY